jgi:hypothetical protein
MTSIAAYSETVAADDKDYGDGTVADDDRFDGIVVTGGSIFLPDRFGLHDDASLFHDCDELPEHEQFVTLEWNGIQDGYRCLSKHNAIVLTVALMDAVLQLH